MAQKKEPALSRRERQIMEIVYRLGSATAAEVLTKFAAWVGEGRPVATDDRARPAARFAVNPRPGMLLDVSAVTAEAPEDARLQAATATARDPRQIRTR